MESRHGGKRDTWEWSRGWGGGGGRGRRGLVLLVGHNGGDCRDMGYPPPQGQALPTRQLSFGDH